MKLSVKWRLDLPILDEVLFSDVVEGVHIEKSAPLQGLSVFDLLLFHRVFIFEDLHFSHLDFLFPPSWAVEFLVVFGEVETSIIKRLIKVFSRHILTYFDKFFSAGRKFVPLLQNSGEEKIASQLRMSNEDVSYILIRVNFVDDFLKKWWFHLTGLSIWRQNRNHTF